MNVTAIQRLSDIEVMSGDTSSPADGGHLRRGLPPSAALRWNHYCFVSPVHQKSHQSPFDRAQGRPVTSHQKLLWFVVALLNMGVSSLGYAEFNYQNPARTGLEEMETRPTGAQQLTGSRFQRQEAVSKLGTIALEKELSKIRKELDKTSKEIQQFRQKSQQYLETEKQRTTQKTQAVRAAHELGFEYFRNPNGMVELYKDGLVGAVLGEPVDETDEEGNVVGRGTRDTVDIEYFKGGAYHRMRKHFKVITRSAREGIQILERDILEYIPGSKWYGTDDPKLTNNFQMVQKYKDVTWSSVTPYKKEARFVSGIIHRGDRRPSEWLEARGTTDSAVSTLTLYRSASYNASKELDFYQSVSWNSEFPEIATVAQWSGMYKNGHLIKETTDQVSLSSSTPTDLEELSDTPKSLMAELGHLLDRARMELRERSFQVALTSSEQMATQLKNGGTRLFSSEGRKEPTTPEESSVPVEGRTNPALSEVEPLRENPEVSEAIKQGILKEGSPVSVGRIEQEGLFVGAFQPNSWRHKLQVILQHTVKE